MSKLLKTGTFSVIPIGQVVYLSFLPVFLEETVAEVQSFQAKKQLEIIYCAKNMHSNERISMKTIKKSQTKNPTNKQETSPKANTN